ncbi:MAG: TonB-dependent receptor [Bacteroidota bacterium]
MNYKLQLIALLLMTSFWSNEAALMAGQTGKIAGKITERKSGEPIIGASVVIQGTKLGASSDFEGDYSIGNVPPGTYSLQITSLGYKTATVRNVVVKIDLTTTIDLKMEETIVELGEAVVIEAERPLVQKDLTSTSVSVSSEELKVMPVENINQVINLQAGVVGGHFRGGRSGEVAYLVDGIPVNNPLTGGAGFIPEISAIREMEVISGTFNAEYGQAMSGVVNSVTQDGSSEFHGTVGVYVGDYFTNHTDVFLNLDKLNLTRTLNYQFSLSGPLPLVPNLTFFTTGRMQNEEGHLYGKRVYNVSDRVPTFPDENNRTVWINHNTGDGAMVPMNPFKKISLNGKLTYGIDAWKLSYSGFWDKANWKSYDHSFRWTPDGIMTHYSENWMQNVQLNHVLGQATYHSLKISLSKYTGKGYLYADPYDPRYVDEYQGQPLSNYTFRSGGNQTWRYENKSQTLIGQYQITSQINKQHKIGAGVEARLHSVFDHGTNITNALVGQVDSLGNPLFKITYPRLHTIGNQQYEKYPYEASAYIQDKIEYDIMIINAGVRFDYFNPNAKLLADLQNPMRNHLFDSISTVSGKIPNPKGPAGTMVAAKEKVQISPRFGISFPITDQGIIHFSYGHFFQIPSFNNLYQNSEYLVSPTNRLQTTMGNPDIDAQRTVMYELGLQQAFTTNLSLDFTVYYRDIRNLLGMEIIKTHEGFNYARFINRDYGNVRGVILSLEKRFEDYYSIRADYTYQIAEGNASDPLSVYYNNQTDPPIETNKKVVPLDWDQRSTLNVTINVGEQGDWMTGFIVNYGSGFPYTESQRVSGGLRFENGGLKPPTYNVDFRAEKTFDFFGLHANAFVLIYNVLDIKNEINVNDASGRANVDLFTDEGGPIYGLNTLQEYLNNPTSFSAPRNVRVGFNLVF